MPDDLLRRLELLARGVARHTERLDHDPERWRETLVGEAHARIAELEAKTPTKGRRR